MTDNSKKIEGQKLDRSFSIDLVRADEDKRTVELAFSSEEPYERWFGTEILSHDPQSVRLDRLNSGAAVLVNHDTKDQVGVVESARVDSDRVARAVIRFSKSQRGEEIYQDVKDGIRKLVSVGYKIHKYTVEEKSDTYTMTDWEPYEVSIVPIPADASVGVGRSQEQDHKPTIEATKMAEDVKTTENEREYTDQDRQKDRAQARKEEMQRINQIREMSEKLDLEELGREAISEGWEYSRFNEQALEAVGKRNNEARSKTKHDPDVDLSNQERNEYSFVRLMDALSNPQDRQAQKRAGFELEVSDAAIKGFGSDFKCRGAFIPDSVLGSAKRDLSAGTATDGAELVATNLIAGSFVEVLRNAMRTMQAGVRVLPGLVGNVAIPRQTSGAAMTWISSEDGDATESEPQFDQLTLNPKDAACYTEVTRRLLQQSTPAIEGLVRTDLATAIGLGLDLAVLYGSGSSGQPEGIVNATGINTKDFSSALPTYAELVNMIRLVLDDNALLGSPSWFIDPEGWEHLMTTPKQASGVEGNFILNNERIVGYPYYSTNQVTAQDFIFGDFSQVIMGEWGGLELNVDPYTHSLKGKIRYVIFKTVDLAIRHPEAFCLGNDAQ